MKQLKSIILVWFAIVMTGAARVNAQPSSEIGCMAHFDYDKAGNSKVNAYLLMMLNHFVYPHFTINKPEDDPQVTELHSNPQKFRDAYKAKVEHYFFEPTKTIGLQLTTAKTAQTLVSSGTGFDFISMTNGVGIDPEASDGHY
jgi:hypothetical protein